MVPIRHLSAFLLWPVVLLTVLALAACNDGSAQSPTPESTSTPTAEATSRPTPTSGSGQALTTPEIVRQLSPSVVRVQTEGARFDILGRPVPTQGVGTGVIIDTEGHIVTNNHVVRLDDRLASRVVVTLSDNRTFTAQVVGTDPPSDLAVLKIDAPNLTPARLGDVSQLEVGEEVVAMGFALDLPGGPTVTKGVVSAKGRVIEESVEGSSYSISSAIQTDASINPGNSGGPLANSNAEVVGINTAIVGQAQNIGFAISMDLAQPLVQEIIANGFVNRGFLGVGVVDVTASLAASFNLPVDSGVGVGNVDPGSPADQAGLQVNDIIVRIGDVDITNSGDLTQALTKYRSGDTVTVTFYRGNDQQGATVTLTERPR